MGEINFKGGGADERGDEMTERKYAIIDLGSNSLRLNLMGVDPNGTYRLMDQQKEMVRLSEGMGAEMILKPQAMERTIRVLKDFQRLIHLYGVEAIFPVATAAVRNAVNQQQFLEKVREETGFAFTVASDQEEAYLGYLGVINTLAIDSCVIMDVGGASIELTWVENRQLKESVSLPFGAVLLTEGFLWEDDLAPEKVKALEQHLIKAYDQVPWLKQVKGLPLVGLGGSARTIGKIHRHIIDFPLQDLHNYQMPRDEVMAVCERVLKAGKQGRKRIPGLSRYRVDIILGGLIPIKVLLKLLRSKRFILSSHGLREGIFFKHYLLERGISPPVLADVLEHSIHQIMNKYQVNKVHGNHVRDLSLSLFDQLQPLHQLEEEDRRLLSIGALLHDIGHYVDQTHHDRHGYYLMLNSRINGLTHREQVMCAFILLMHHELKDKVDLTPYRGMMSKGDWEVVRILSVCLQIAEKLDRSQRGLVTGVVCTLGQERVEVLVQGQGDISLEMTAAQTSEGNFKKVFGKKLSLRDGPAN